MTLTRCLFAFLVASTAFAVDPGPSTSATAAGHDPARPTLPPNPKPQTGPGSFIADVADSGFAAPIPDRSTEPVDRERSKHALAMDGDLRRKPEGLKATPKPQPTPVNGQPTQSAQPPAQNPAAEKQSPTAEAPKQERQQQSQRPKQSGEQR